MTMLSRGIVGLDDSYPLLPENNLVHDFQKFSRLVFFSRQLDSMSVNVSCFIACTTIVLMVLY